MATTGDPDPIRNQVSGRMDEKNFEEIVGSKLNE
jgi:hypothetical protein